MSLTLREKIKVYGTPEEVWPFIVTPELFVKWSGNISHIEARDRFVAGQIFTTHYRLNRSGGQCLSEVTALEEGRLLELTHKAVSAGPAAGPQEGLRAVERITLSGSGPATVVDKVVRVWNHGIPWYIMPLVWLLARIGRPVKPSPLQGMVLAKKT